MDEQAQNLHGQSAEGHDQFSSNGGIPQVRRRLGRGLSSLIGGLSDGPALMDPGAEREAVAVGEKDGGATLPAIGFVDLDMQGRAIVGCHREFLAGHPLERMGCADLGRLEAI